MMVIILMTESLRWLMCLLVSPFASPPFSVSLPSLSLNFRVLVKACRASSSFLFAAAKHKGRTFLRRLFSSAAQHLSVICAVIVLCWCCGFCFRPWRLLNFGQREIWCLLSVVGCDVCIVSRAPEVVVELHTPVF